MFWRAKMCRALKIIYGTNGHGAPPGGRTGRIAPVMQQKSTDTHQLNVTNLYQSQVTDPNYCIL